MSQSQILDQLSQILKGVLSIEANERNQSEKYIVMMMQDPNNSLLLLSQILSYAKDNSVKMLAAILLKQQFSIESENCPWMKINHELQEVIKANLLSAVSQEKERTNIKQICNAISELAAAIIEQNG